MCVWDEFLIYWENIQRLDSMFAHQTSNETENCKDLVRAWWTVETNKTNSPRSSIEQNICVAYKLRGLAGLADIWRQPRQTGIIFDNPLKYFENCA